MTATSTDDDIAASEGLLKDDAVYPKEDNFYAYDEECEEEHDLDNVDVFQLF